MVSALHTAFGALQQAARNAETAAQTIVAAPAGGVDQTPVRQVSGAGLSGPFALTAGVFDSSGPASLESGILDLKRAELSYKAAAKVAASLFRLEEGLLDALNGTGT